MNRIYRVSMILLCVLVVFAPVVRMQWIATHQPARTLWDFTHDEPADLDSILGHTNFAAAIIDETVFEDESGKFIKIHRMELGELQLPTGRIVVCDPMNLESSNLTPLIGEVPSGRYPIYGSIAKIPIGDATDDRMACVVMQLTSETPVYWKMACTAKDDLSKVSSGGFVGYSVDTGSACFVDVQTALRIKKDPALYDQIRNNHAPFCWNITDQKTHENVIAFSTGFGDGSYPCYWGFSATYQLCCLATDFGILGKPVEKSLSIDFQKVLDGTFDSTPLKEAKVEVRADLNWNASYSGMAKMLSSPLIQNSDKLPDTVRDRMKDIQTTPPAGHYCTVSIKGDAEVSLNNAGTDYNWIHSSNREGVSTYQFKFAEKLQPTAKLNLKYVTGWKSFHRRKSDPAAE